MCVELVVVVHCMVVFVIVVLTSVCACLVDGVC